MADVAKLPVPSRNVPSEPRASILLVDDNQANLLSLRAILEDLGHDLVEARSGEEALQRVQSDEFAVVLLDVLMPGMSGFETAKLIRRQDRSRHTPVIFLTASDTDRPQLEEGYALGAVDFLVKPLVPVVLQSKVRGFIELFQDKQRARHEADQLRLLVHGTTEYAIFMLDPQGHVVTWNAGAERLKGYNAEEIIGQHFSRFYPKDSIDRGWPAHELKVAQADGRFEDEGWRVRKDGTQFWANVVITALKDEQGRLLGFSKITRDLTERKKSEENARRLAEETAARRVAALASRRNQELLQLIHKIGKIGHWEWNSITDENKWSPEIEALYGLPPGGFEGSYQGWAKLLHPDDLPKAEEDVRRAMKTGEYFSEFRVIWPDGSVHWLETRAHVFKDDHDTPVRIMGVNMNITERKRVEERLRASEGRFRSLTSLAPVGIFETDSRGNCLFVNEKWCRLAGLTPEQAHGQGWVRALHPDDRERVGHEWYTAAEAGGEFSSEYRFRSDDGTVSWLQGSAVPLKTEAGAVAGYIGTVTDLTGRRAVEDQVRFQAHLLDSVGQAAIVTDPDGTITYWNRYAETLYGWSRADALGRNIIEVVVAPAAMGQAAEIMDRLRAGENWTGEFLVRRRDGTTFPAFVTDTPIFDDRGRLTAIIGISADISDRKRVEQALRFLADASATLAAVVDYQSTLQKVAGMAVPHFADWCAVDMVDPDGSVRRLAVAHADPAKVKLAHDLQGRYPPDPNSAHGLPKVLRTGESDMMADIPDELIVQGAQDEDHLRILRDLGLKSYMCVPLKGRGRLLGVVTFVSAESGRCYTQADLAFAEELGRRAAIAIENAQLYADLRQADRLKDEFLAMLAHELRNPLAPVRNALHIMNQPGANGTILQQVRDMAERQVQHMARLLDDLLDVSRISRGRIELRNEDVDVAAVIRRTEEAVRPLLKERRHDLAMSLPAVPLQVEADPTRLEQVLTNLLNNAAKYTDPGGHIWLTAERDGREVVVRVRDTGIGIAPEMLPRIFDLFVQAERRLDRSQGGVGIGLTLVKKLVELHGGRIEANSAGLGWGSEFVVRLPALPDRHPGEKTRTSDDVDVAELPCRRVLVVDDNQDAADSLAMLLRLAGQDVRAAYDGSSALTHAKDFRPALVFLDIGMPGMDGYDVARRLRGEPSLQGVVIVAMTGWGQDEDRRRSQEAGFDHHLVKPVEPTALEDLLGGLRTLP